MLQLLIRQAKRAIILAVGLVTLWFIVDQLFPFIDNRLPLYLALVVTYIISAYFFIPLVVRVVRLFFRPNHVPLYTTTPDGFACDPINLAVVGSRADLVAAMTKAGWYEAEPRTLRTALRLVYCWLRNVAYPTAPFSTLYVFGRRQDIGFEKPVGDSARKRHHVRFWCVSLEGRTRFKSHVQFWLHRHRDYLKDQQLWIGAATKDIGIGPIRHNAQLTHRIDPDTNAERDYTIETLKKVRVLRRVERIKIGDPYTLKNRVLGITMIADGEVKLLILKPAKR
jgi:hypothetical protein